MVFRFEYYENVISKHFMHNLDWRQSAQWAFFDNNEKSDVTIASVK